MMYEEILGICGVAYTCDHRDHICDWYYSTKFLNKTQLSVYESMYIVEKMKKWKMSVEEAWKMKKKKCWPIQHIAKKINLLFDSKSAANDHD